MEKNNNHYHKSKVNFGLYSFTSVQTIYLLNSLFFLVFVGIKKKSKYIGNLSIQLMFSIEKRI